MVSWTGHARGGDAGRGRGDPGDDGRRASRSPSAPTIQAIAFVVSVGTLLIQGWTLPLLISRLHLSRFSDDHAADREETLKAERVVHDAADEVLAEFRANPPEGLDPRVLAEIRDDHRAALAGRRRDARPRRAHDARRGVRDAVPRRAGARNGPR